MSGFVTRTRTGTQSRHDVERKIAPAPQRLPAEEVERLIRARERETIRWLREKPWTAGGSLARIVANARRIHTESIARSRAR